jgi:translation elongation factor P/translation initiation factor 5A
MNEFREGARIHDKNDSCPKCGLAGVLTMDFNKFGKHKVHVCLTCRAVYENGKKQSDVTVGEA